MRARCLPALVLWVCCMLVNGPTAQAKAKAQQQQPTSLLAEPLQSPSAFLGYALGTQFTPYPRVAAYARYVAAASPRAQLRRYGQSYEGRPLLRLVLSAPKNLVSLEAIRRRHLRRVGFSESESPQTGKGDAEQKAIVWFSYNVHGDEAASTEAALKTLYALANPQDERTGRWLQDTVVLLDPCLNPDGRARYVQGYRRRRGPRPDAHPTAREHEQPWPGGRFNHYLFDLNRDWAWATQQETRARLDLYHRWMPHVHVDFHEQEVEAPYYFAPGAEPRHERLTNFQNAFQKTVGRRNARAFDRRGWRYFTDEVFDLFYPGYGDTWPLFNGAIGMTYEQGGGGRAGLMIQTDEGDTLSLKDRIAHHYVSALTTLKTAARERERLVSAFDDYYRSARRDPPGRHAAYLVKSGNEDRLEALARLLDRQRIRYQFAGGEAAVRGRSYRTGKRGRVRIQEGDLIVPAAQPKARLADVLFEPHPALSDSLTYDITAWALPYAFDLDAYTLNAFPDGVLLARKGLRHEMTPAPPDAGAAAPYAYLAAWKSLADARLLGRLLQKGVRVRFAHAPFEAAGRHWPRGTLIALRADNEHLGDRFVHVAQEAAHGQPLVPVESGLTAQGPDFGSADMSFLEKPRVGLLSGAPLSPTSVGEAWHFFDHRLRYPATRLSTDDFNIETLSDYDVLVLPSGSYGDLFSEEDREGLRRWVKGGGRLIALGGAVGLLAEADGFGIERKHSENEKHSENDESAPSSPQRYGRRRRAAATRRVPGAVFRARLDPTHPLAYGYSGEAYFTLKRGADAFAPLEDGWNVATLGGDDGSPAAPVSGFAGAEAQRKLAGSLVFGVEEVGEGRVVYLVDDPLFRGFWQGGMLLFSNAVFLVR